MGQLHNLALVWRFGISEDVPLASGGTTTFGYARFVKERELEIINVETIVGAVGLLSTSGYQWIIDRFRGKSSVIDLVD